jgi:4a-hydroxytetrahydrobiopterin dehydratase
MRVKTPKNRSNLYFCRFRILFTITVCENFSHFTEPWYRNTVMDLTQKKCVPCEAGTPPLGAAAVAEFMKSVPALNVVDVKKLSREFKFKDFTAAMAFVNRVAAIAESEGHHPDIYIFYNLVRLELSTHAIGGLSENDFIVAAKIDALS